MSTRSITLPEGTDLTTYPEVAFEHGTWHELGQPERFFYWGRGHKPDINADLRLVENQRHTDGHVVLVTWDHEDLDAFMVTDQIWITRAAPGVAFWEAVHAAEIQRCADSSSGQCTLCEAEAGFRIPWAGERVCMTCADAQLDLLAKALDSEPVHVGHSGAGGRVTRILHDPVVAAGSLLDFVGMSRQPEGLLAFDWPLSAICAECVQPVRQDRPDTPWVHTKFSFPMGPADGPEGDDGLAMDEVREARS